MFNEWIQGSDWPSNNWNVTSNIRGDYGIFHVYAFTMTVGVILAIAISAVKLMIKGIPLRELWIGAAIIVPVSLLGASFFGKLNADGIGQNAGDASFWGLFAFWKAGMAIHGGVYAGALIGMIIFYFLGRRTKVSLYVYMDAIIPNILVGQGIGRWGNFFNHELPGMPIYNVSSGVGKNPVGWLPNWLIENTQIKYAGSGGSINGIELNNGDLYQMEPIFLYESFGLIISWIVITFLIPGIGKWISKKPWKIDPSKYSFDINYSFKRFFFAKKQEDKITYWESWNKAFYRNLNLDKKEEYIKLSNNIVKEKSRKKDLTTIRSQKKSELNKKLSEIKLQNLSADVKKSQIDKSRLEYKKFITPINQEIKIYGNYLSYKWTLGKKLEEANNPNKYKIIKAGCETGGYFFLWNLVRFILESNRPNDHLFIMYEKTFSLVLIGLTGLFGLVLMIISQNIIPILFRKPGFTYEKEYFFIDEDIKPKKEKKVTKNIINKISKEEKAKQKLEALKRK